MASRLPTTLGCLLGLALLAAPDALAQNAPIRIEDALRDTDGDRIPDTLGEVLTVVGRATSDAGAFGQTGASFYVQDATGGLAVAMVNRTDQGVSAGDSVVVTGTFEFAFGSAMLRDATVSVKASGSTPAPVAYLSSAPERVEGQLVEVEGIVLAQSRVEAGQVLSLTLDNATLLVAFVYAGAPDGPSMNTYVPGDRVRVVGVAGQFDRVAPYSDSYQIYPRTGSDVRSVGISGSMYRQGALVVLGLLALAIGWVTILHRQVNRRVDQLRRSEDRYGKVVDLASDVIAIHDLDGQNVELNRMAREAIGCGPDEAPPPLFDVLLPEEHEAARDHVAQLQKHGHSRTELHLACTDGHRLFEFDSQLIMLDGAPRVLSLARDVSVRRAYEAGLIEAREQAEETARIKSAFLANMSHEIRTPLTAVIGFADLLRYEVDDDHIDLVLAIEAGGTRLLNTLNSVLDLAQIDAGRQRIRPVELDLVEHVERSLAVLRPHAETQGLALDFDVADAALIATLDAGAFDRVLTNLVGNAVKFTDEGRVTVALRSEANEVVLTVSDTGIGIEAAFLADLFSEFRQESEGHSRSHEGSGLGLAITQRLVELMEGTVTVESEKGAGTTFTVRLPREMQDTVATEAIGGTLLVTNRATSASAAPETATAAA